MKIFLPYRGEFGHKLMGHVPTVYACKDEKIVCCEVGEECLFPNATEHIIVDRLSDIGRRQHMHHDVDFIETLKKKLMLSYKECEFISYNPHARKEFFIPDPVVKKGIRCDIVVCPRKRGYGTLKNWLHWENLVKALQERHRVFAAGSPDASFDVPCEKAWDYDRYLDASIEGIISSKFVVSTDSGLAFLALLCGKEIHVISWRDGGTADNYAKIDMRRYTAINHKNVKVNIMHNTWTDLNAVLSKLERAI